MKMAKSTRRVIALVGIAAWARHLTHAQRNGSDDLYSAAIPVVMVSAIAREIHRRGFALRQLPDRLDDRGRIDGTTPTAETTDPDD